ncbi:MAG: type I-E CRISPR-associated protein Cas6/Cse3/CasE [Phycisphaerae bacterium]|nr:type I-E CRISPR-associated protein Cas6/Cse3/CasE [Phycisphaerae bacterium]NUQ45342.1 type I-E CRISPR-associated protein Cas6/Cse3/CasE [Phycisphaerae bacterium]
MYHSHLLINVGDNPDRPDWNITRRWLRNLYRVHQRLCMAFPPCVPATVAERIAAYCAPYGGCGAHDRDLPGEGDPGVPPCSAPVHSERSDEAGFLFRIDHPVCDVVNGRATRSGHPRRRPVIVVQSGGDQPPDWGLAFGLSENAVDDRGRPIGNAAHLLAGPPQYRKVSFTLEGDALRLSREDRPDGGFTVRPGDLVRFRLRANPCRKVQDGSPNGKRKRVMPTFDAHAEWLHERLDGAVGSPICIDTFVPGWAAAWRTKHEPQANQKMQFWSVLFEGTFRVGDTAALKSRVKSGIGPAKAFGFGLLSIAPVR